MRPRGIIVATESPWRWEEVRGPEEDAEAWAAEFEALLTRIGRHFVRPEVRRRVHAYVRGLLSPVERKNSWQVAEHVGDPTPDGMQRLLAAARWDADAVRDDLRAYVVEHLADDHAVLIVDETSFLKKGKKSVGVQPQYSGTAGKIANCQIGTFLAYAGAKGHAFLDRDLYLPRTWVEDAGRRAEAGVPVTVGYRSKTDLALGMLTRALDAGVTARWVVADALYGSDSALRRWLEQRQQGYVLALRSNVYLWDPEMYERVTVATRIARLHPRAWERHSAGDGTKGPRTYDWVCLPIERDLPANWGFWLLARRSITDSSEIAYYFVFGPATTTFEQMIAVAGRRWKIEDALEGAKGQVGLDQYEVRHWPSWYRHITLALLAHAFLTVMRAQTLEKGAA
jgi:SRSO17 transposase